MKNGDYCLAVAPPEYPGKKYRGRYCPEHHLVWWQNTGEVVPPGYEIHHKDKNKQHNVFDNLELLSSEEHRKLHATEKTRRMVTLTCPSCGTEFTRERRQTHLCKGGNPTSCSRSCSAKKRS